MSYYINYDYLYGESHGPLSYHPEYCEWYPFWCASRDVIGGVKRIKDDSRARLYLPPLERHIEHPALYEDYKRRAFFYNASGKTVDAFYGLITRKEPQITLPANLEDRRDYVKSYILWALRETVSLNRCGLLVDATQWDGSLRTIAEMELAGDMAYICKYPAESIVNWREVTSSNIPLKRVIIVDCKFIDSETSEYATDIVYILRVLELDEDGYYRQKIYYSTEQHGWQLANEIYPLMNNERMREIPFQFFDSVDNSPKPKDIDLFDLYDTNLSHYLTSATKEHGEYWLGLSTLVVSSTPTLDANEVILGPGGILSLHGGATWGSLGITDQGMSHLRQTLKDKEEYMAKLGSRMLQTDVRGVEAVDTAKIHRTGEWSVLASLANNVAKGGEMVAKWFTQWNGGNTDDVTVELNTDFMPGILSGQDLTALIQSWQSGAISYETLFDNLQRGEIQREDRTVEDEKEFIEQEQQNSVSLFRVPEA